MASKFLCEHKFLERLLIDLSFFKTIKIFFKKIFYK